MVRIRPITGGEYTDWMIRPDYQRHHDLGEANHAINRCQFEYDGHWDQLRIEDDYGRILARKRRWQPLELWDRNHRRFYVPDQQTLSVIGLAQ